MEKDPSVWQSKFFEIRLNSIVAGIPLAFDIFLVVSQKPTLFRRKGDVLTSDRLKDLIQHGGDKFLVPEDQRQAYLDSLKSVIHNPSTNPQVKAKILKESAFLHVQDLFTKQDMMPVITEAKGLIEEMVNFISTDLAAAASLMRLSAHDYYTYNHCVDVAVYSIVLAKKIIGEDKEMLITAGLSGMLHDIGKKKIPWSIINKNSTLTPNEWSEIKRHPSYGKDFLQETKVPPEVHQVVYEHHENFDGTGYPNNRRGEDISKLARVVMIADVFDALTTDRSYHKAVQPNEALNMMFGMQPGKFDPTIFRSFNKNFDKRASLILPDDFDPCSQDAFTKALKKAS